ncbi:E3 ubiquitin-protein ligase SMURF2-like isoform X2 [Antedon mediterranea]|uniref:E3 ubiquitin-protein ligase SMURF2-like isoform X2 n=1 Tax=Antedon mediterranea TaxID=105859 RepID=UPI003AF7BE99
MPNHTGRRDGPMKLRLTVLCAKNVYKRDFFRLPDAFAKVVVDGSGQCHSTCTCKGTLDPKWNQHYDLFVGKNDSITISLWNHRKIHKKQGAGFLGCVRILSNAIQRLKDTGYQRLDLCKQSPDDNETVRGQIVISLMSRYRGAYSGSAVIDSRSICSPLPPADPNELPEGPAIETAGSSSGNITNHLVSTRSVHQARQRTNEEGGSKSSVRRQSSRFRNYQNRSTLHQTLDLPEGYEQRTTAQGQVYFLDTGTGLSTWHDPRLPRDLAIREEELGTLPHGWEARRTPSSRVYFVDHNNRTTQFTDPRLNAEIINRALTERKRGESSSPQAPRYQRDLVQKLKSIHAELQQLQPQTGHCRLEVSRENIFEESYRQIMKLKPKDLRKRLMIKFKSEEGLDYGGIAREWLYLLSHEMLNPYYGLFQYSRDDIYTLQINPDSGVNPDHLSYFHFVGRAIGMAVFHAHYIDGGFTMPFYKQLLGKPVSLDDMEGVDPDLHRSLCWMLENDITDIIQNNFAVDHDCFGQLTTSELKPNGKNIPVTMENKKEYVKLYVQWRFLRGIEPQFLALQKGFNELIPQHLLRPFDERELELIINGLGKIDVEDWQSNTRLKHCSVDSNIVKWFWKAVQSFDEEKRARLLQFVTGTSKVPLQGFKALQGSTGAAGPRLFTIHLVQDTNTDNLPKAHTCFNRIDFPPYESYEKFFDKLTCAVEETCGFTVE